MYQVFGYTFPLEGNGNKGKPGSILHLESFALWIYFPARREWKLGLSPRILVDTPLISLWIYFPDRRELKLRQLYTLGIWHQHRCSLDILSRSKGMETITSCCMRQSFFDSFGYTFPIEGNETAVTAVQRIRGSREGCLNILSRSKGMETRISHTANRIPRSKQR